MRRHIIYNTVLLLTIIWASTACSTEKNTALSRGYHQLTSYYNIYFNGNEAMKIGLLKVEQQIEEDYTQILPIFKESLPQTGEMVSSDMDIAIEKATKLIKMHSMTTPPKNRKQSARRRKPVKHEYNRFVDDAYIMMGKAFLYKKDYFRAHATFSLVIRNYKDDPVKYDAYLWLIRTLTESERYTEASEAIALLENEKEFPKKLEGELAIMAANNFLAQNQYNSAISYLDIGVKKIKGNKRKSRYHYIMAQLHQETGNFNQALLAYRQVIRRRPDYDMMFNARISSARVMSGDGNTAELRRELNKLRRQKRNARYLDQIYYALGSISQSEGKIDEAEGLYRQSVAASNVNIHQRALSSITLSEMLFEQKRYIPSGLYLDSAMVIIDEHYPNYKSLEAKHLSLGRLVGNLQRVETEDSLQYIAKLSEPERNALINKWIDTEKTKIERALAEDAQNQYTAASYRGTTRRINTQSGGGSSWYFYNPSTIAYGKKDFQRIWGERKLEDDWRRSNKTESLNEEEELEMEAELAKLAEEIGEPRNDDPTSAAYYLQDVPLTDELMEASHNRIRDALYDAGILFKSEFNDMEQSIQCFRELDRRYPQNIYTLPSYFYLWDLYTTVEKADSSAYFKNWIINNHPNSNYAKFLINPNYFIELEAQKEKVNQLHLSAFNSYKLRDFNQATNFVNQAMALKPDSTVIPKLQFIRMVSTSRSLPQGQFSDSLTAYINTYPKAEPVELAKQIQALLKDNRLSDHQELVRTGYISNQIQNMELLERRAALISDESILKWDNDQSLLHYFVIAFPAQSSVDLNRLKFDLANYNLDHYTSRDFDIEIENLNTDTRLLIIRNLDNKDAAMIYFLSIIRRPEVFRSLGGTQFFNFTISNINYRQMVSDRSYDDYLGYFVKNYSSFTKGQFTEEELESPEQLMARKAQEDAVLQERGQFVVVETAQLPFDETITKQDELYKLNYNTPHSVVVYIQQRGFRTGLLMRSFVQYNNNNHRDKRLRVTPAMAPEGTILLITPLENAFVSRNYMVNARDQKALFESIGEVPYSMFSITQENLSKLQETGKVADYEAFHNQYYMQRRPPNPAEKTEQATGTAATTSPASDQVQTTATPSTTAPVAQTESKVEPSQVTIAPIVDKTVTVPATTEEPATETAPIIEEQKATEAPNEVTEPSAEAKTTEIEPAVASNAYKADPESPHQFALLVPAKGFNSALLISYLRRFNATTFSQQTLQVENEVLNDEFTLVRVSVFANQANAQQYLNGVTTDQRVTMSLRNVKHHAVIISNSNLEQLKTTKDAENYLQFFRSNISN